MPYEQVVRSKTQKDEGLTFILACGCLHNINTGKITKCGPRIKVDNSYVLSILADGAKKSKYHIYYIYHNCVRR